jgi:hypothetical protein
MALVRAQLSRVAHAPEQEACNAIVNSRQKDTTERQLSDEEVTVIGFALLLATGNEAITSQIRDDATRLSPRQRCASPIPRVNELMKISAPDHPGGTFTVA